MVKRSRTFIAVPPGATIKEQIQDRGMTQKELAERLGVSEKHMSKLINGEVQLTMDIAYRLEMVLGIPASFWCNLEARYREVLQKIKEENAMDEDKLVLKRYPYKQMAQNGWVEDKTSQNDKVIELRKFFEVAELTYIEAKNLIPKIACRRLSENEKADYALLAWAQEAKIEARNIDTAPINIERLIAYIPRIRKMTAEPPSLFSSELKDIMAKCGVALVFLPHIKGSYLHGATFLDGKKFVIGLTVRGKDSDRFWFSLFHELAHIINGDTGKPFQMTIEDEKRADEFAKDTLIPMESYSKFINKKVFSRDAIIGFADSVGIAPGIVVGRLQKEGLIDYNWHNDLKVKYKIA